MSIPKIAHSISLENKLEQIKVNIRLYPLFLNIHNNHSGWISAQIHYNVQQLISVNQAVQLQKPNHLVVQLDVLRM